MQRSMEVLVLSTLPTVSENIGAVLVLLSPGKTLLTCFRQVLVLTVQKTFGQSDLMIPEAAAVLQIAPGLMF